MMRLDKYLADCRVGTRTEVKKLIKAGKVIVNGAVFAKPEQKVNEESDNVAVLGKAVIYEKCGYYLFHKPAGCVTAAKDRLHKTVMDYFDPKQFAGFAPVGRLDLDTEGFLLITNDGALTHHLISPSHHVPKTYYVETDGPIPEETKELFLKGIDIGDDTVCLPAELIIDEPKKKKGQDQVTYSARLTIYEGRFHQVKRMFQAIGRKVLYLKRLSMGDLTLGDLPCGKYRKLNAQEVRKLTCGMK